MESLCHKRDRAKYYATGSLVASGAWYGQGWYGRGFLQPVCLALFSMDADIRRFGAVGGLGIAILCASRYMAMDSSEGGGGITVAGTATVACTADTAGTASSSL